MICPECKFAQPDENVECPRCGIVFEKYRALQEKRAQERMGPKSREPQVAEEEEEKAEKPTIASFSKELFLYINPQINPFYLAGRVIVFLIISIWGWRFILTPLESTYIAQSFMHLVNLPFHEAGHIIFSPFGKFIATLGGTLGQLFMPLICCVALLIKTRDPFGASVALWWLSESFMDIAPLHQRCPGVKADTARGCDREGRH